MRLTSLIHGRTEAETEPAEGSGREGSGGVRGRLLRQLRSGRLAIATGLLWIVRGLRSSERRGRRLALGGVAVAVGLFQRRSQREGSTLPEGDLTETIRGESDDGATRSDAMTAVELDDRAPEPPEDVETDMEASDELTGGTEPDESGTDPDPEMTEETAAGDEHETDIGTAGEDESGIDLGTDGEAADEANGADESMAVETGEEAADPDETGEADDTPPDVSESFEDDESEGEDETA